MSPNLQGPTHDAMCDALLAHGPAPELTADNDLFGWLIGAWNVEVHDFESDGARRVSNGEWYFAWVLEGRAIQDVFVSPRRDERSFGTIPNNRYGTTLRIFDVASGMWRAVWINPVSNAIDLLSIRRDEANIVQEGVRLNGNGFRWTFSDIGENSFIFRADESSDDTGSWNKLAELTATRRR